jgi:hypothetical protein
VARKLVFVAGVIDSGYRYIREDSERRFEYARCAKPFRRVRKDSGAAFAAIPDYIFHGCFSRESFWKAASMNIGR